ncbi:unnamed protein product [Clonostachys solani]|uniref:Granaticin polyketide synthase ketoacyl reductase 2 n=1 Tax=Clonostachys solani TaxID=160281 RepID=A0A9N9Z0N7_9HYPO|nr:unnamed protein product [Clonostachys solani]
MGPSPVILVTAGSAGLGSAVARLFAHHGYRVVINYNTDSERARTLVAELSAQHAELDDVEGMKGIARYISVQADLASALEIRRLVEETYAAMGRIDVVLSNGGWTKFRDTSSIDDNVFEEDWDRAFNMNVKSHLWLLQASKRYLEETEGAFITTASLAGVTGAYGTTKAAQIHMVKGLACMVAPKIRVNSVSPGLLQTKWATRFTAEQKEAHRQGTKLKRFVDVEDVAEQVLGLAKSKSMTGTNIIVDAGYRL